ncbi:MmgE/PrpD family protein [Propionibacteriaceae bacterium G57]|uniref:MmgE/PrpD family protein n=1 Tax=Aestuariimicrobium sp. G57 TaxID=3418485 RepID=UPI003DA70EAE
MGTAETAIATAAASGTWTAAVTLHRARVAITDTLPVVIAGAPLPQAACAAATVFATGSFDLAARDWLADRMLAVDDAAFVLGTAAHSLDWDDYHHPMHGHCSSVLLGTLLPLAEALDSTGAELVQAYLAGYQADHLTSLALSHAHYRRGWHATSTIGTIGAAAAASRLLRLDTQRTATALAIAASGAAGIRANFGTMTKAFHAGNAARAGIQAALLARAGATASPDWLLGPSGMLACFGGEFEALEAERQVREGAEQPHGIESRWGLIQKLYPCCGSVHGALAAAIDAVTDAGVPSSDITQVVAHVDPLVTQIMRVGRPVDAEGARYSPTWLLAAAVVDGAVGPDQVGDKALGRQDIHDLRARVEVITDLGANDDTRFGGRVDVHHTGGTSSAVATYPPGHPAAPLTPAQLEAKSLTALGTVMDEARARRLHDAIADLHHAPVRHLTGLIRASLDA